MHLQFVRSFPVPVAAAILMCLMSTACSPVADDSVEARGGDESDIQAAGSERDASDLESSLRKGMAYGEFRALVVGQGWEPVPDPECRTNLLGSEAEAMCESNPALSSCHVCADVPELQSCSSDARCLMRFRHPHSGTALEARAYGEIEYWNETGEDAGLQVTGWEFVTSPGA